MDLPFQPCSIHESRDRWDLIALTSSKKAPGVFRKWRGARVVCIGVQPLQFSYRCFLIQWNFSYGRNDWLILSKDRWTPPVFSCVLGIWVPERSPYPCAMAPAPACGPGSGAPESVHWRFGPMPAGWVFRVNSIPFWDLELGMMIPQDFAIFLGVLMVHLLHQIRKMCRTRFIYTSQATWPVYLHHTCFFCDVLAAQIQIFAGSIVRSFILFG